MIRWLAVLIAAVCAAAAPALAKPKPVLKVLYEIALDIDQDGKNDRAALVLVGTPGGSGFYGFGNAIYRPGPGERVDLYIYPAAGDEKLDLSRKPAFLKTNIVDFERMAYVGHLGTKGVGSLIVSSCYGCGASKSMEETLTIVHRRGEFLVAGYGLVWEWSTHTADDVRISDGDCDLNLLSGKGVVAYDLAPSKPLKGKFKPVKLANWSEKTRPQVCDGLKSQAIDKSLR